MLICNKRLPAQIWGRTASYNTEFPQLEDDACGWDAAGTPERYTKPYAKAVRPCAEIV